LEYGIPSQEVEKSIGCGNNPPGDWSTLPHVKLSKTIGTYHGTIEKAMIRHSNWPRIMLIYLGRREVTSAANGMKLQAMDVPRVANAKLAEAKNTPARAFDEYDSSRIRFRRS
jgi:hypothetical protein